MVEYDKRKKKPEKKREEKGNLDCWEVEYENKA